MKKIMLVLLLVGLFYLMVSLIPKYPNINSKLSYNEVTKQVSNITKENIENFSFYYMDDTRKILDFKKSTSAYLMKLKNCQKNTSCIINQYEDYMNDNVAPSIRVSNRIQYMENKFGSFGVFINKKIMEYY
jgi:hypothetical protein